MHVKGSIGVLQKKPDLYTVFLPFWTLKPFCILTHSNIYRTNVLYNLLGKC